MKSIAGMNYCFAVSLCSTQELITSSSESLNHGELVESAVQLDSKAKNMCLKNDLLLYIKPIYDTIYEAHKGVDSVEVELVEDPEIPNYEKMCFEIHLTGEPTQILEDEKTLYTLFFEKIPEDKEHFFVFTYRII